MKILLAVDGSAYSEAAVDKIAKRAGPTSMSTCSAYLLAWSSVATRDVIACVRKRDLNERTTIWLTRVIAFAIGLFLFVFGLWYQIPDTAFQYLFITGAMYTASALGRVPAGIYQANNIGAYCALAMGRVSPSGISHTREVARLVAFVSEFCDRGKLFGFVEFHPGIRGNDLGISLDPKRLPTGPA